jgi:hypothetical protein
MIRVMHEHMPCLTDIRCGITAPAGLHAEINLSASTQSHHVQTRACRLTSYKVLKGLDWLDLQQVVTQLTSLSLQYSCTIPAANLDRQGDAQMLAGLAQLSELRHLDTGNCNFVPADGALCLLLPSYVLCCSYGATPNRSGCSTASELKMVTSESIHASDERLHAFV